ncbi:MAG: HU family DNA-binding protein [Candidatus Kaiserbacteria bacterium]|nr:HU family DNA-binding protein [Candidatus Kaiserbacteria bacterium]
MNKANLVEKIQDDTGSTRSEAERIVETLFDSIIDEVKKGETVSIAGFGIFEAKERAARTGRNPKTGETIQIKASVSPKFRAAKAFKDAVNG